MALDLAHRLLAYRFNMSYVPVPVVPEFIDMLKVLYTKEEAWIAALIPPAFASAETIANYGGRTRPRWTRRSRKW